MVQEGPQVYLAELRHDAERGQVGERAQARMLDPVEALRQVQVRDGGVGVEGEVGELAERCGLRRGEVRLSDAALAGDLAVDKAAQAPVYLRARADIDDQCTGQHARVYNRHKLVFSARGWLTQHS